ncbi:MAG: nucleoside/nucleotide kinase family protein [Lachnospiraceae bacterium]
MAEDCVTFDAVVNGLPVHAVYPAKTVQQVLLPLLRQLTALWKKKGSRLVVFLAAPPGAGKSTLAAFLEDLSAKAPGVHPLQAVGLDGFHYPNAWLDSHTTLRNGKEVPLRAIKGAAETFDVDALKGKLAALGTGLVRFPIYDRRLHDVIPEALPVTGDIILLEGNWLLLSDPRWEVIAPYADFAIRILCGESLVRERLIKRKVQGGLTLAEAENFYKNSDAKNVRRVLTQSRDADLTLVLSGDGSLTPLQGKEKGETPHGRSQNPADQAAPV